MSTENEVSVVSARNILKNLDQDKYEIYPIYIDLEGKWYEYQDNYDEIEFGQEVKDIKEIENVISYLKNLDVIFPVLHGSYGEDGTIQGLFELLKIPYVGCGVLASSVGMDKIYTKIVFEKAEIKQAKHCYLRAYKDNYIFIKDNFEEEELPLEDACKKIEEKNNYPMFVKPSNSGSSVGVSKANNRNELEKAIEVAKKYDCKIIVEQGICGKEVECAVLGNENVIAGEVGQIKAADEFYSFDAKYANQESKTVIPAEISQEKIDEIKKLAVKAFKSIDGKGLSRVDFFVEDGTGDVYLNEINTLPGFTKISMYPQLMNAYGISYKDLLDRLIELALNK